jgi:hypothetical protein
MGKTRRGRPQKYGEPSQILAVTLPTETIRALSRLDADLGWAIVRLVEKTGRASRPESRPAPDAELVEVGRGQYLIVVNAAAFHALPGVQMIPLSEARAFLALAPGQGMADLELAVIDRLAYPATPERERRALDRLLLQLRKWRRDRHLIFHARSIIIVSGPRPTARAPRGR